MKYLRKLFEKLSENRIARNIVLIICSVIIFCFVIYILLDVFTRHNKYKTVPDFVGTGISEARQMADKDRLRIEISDSLFVPAYEGGVILEQQPAAGGKVKSGRRIFVTVNSFRQKMVKVPYVTGYSLRQAKNILEVAGLEIAELKYVDDIATNYVREEYCDKKQVTPTTRMEAEMGSGVTLYVGVEEGHGTTVVPRLVGLPLMQAKGRLWELGLNVGRVDFDEGVNLLNQKDTRVYVQIPGAERSAGLGSKVDLRLTLDGAKVDKHRAEAEKQAQAAAEERRLAEQQLADSLAQAALEEAAEPAAEQPANNDNEGFFD